MGAHKCFTVQASHVVLCCLCCGAKSRLRSNRGLSLVYDSDTEFIDSRVVVDCVRRVAARDVFRTSQL